VYKGDCEVRAGLLILAVASVVLLAHRGSLCGGQGGPPGVPELDLLASRGTFRFAERLRLGGDYTDAITEYRRFIFFNPDSPLKDQALFAIGDSYFRLRRFDKALEVFGRIALFGPDSLRSRSRIMMARCYMERGEPALAEIELDSAMKAAGDEDELAELLYWKGWNRLKRYDWDGARSAFSEASSLSGIR